MTRKRGLDFRIGVKRFRGFYPRRSLTFRRKEDQVFKGGLQVLVERDKITAINILPVKDYLMSK